jgi:hypothetical protein
MRVAVRALILSALALVACTPDGACGGIVPIETDDGSGGGGSSSTGTDDDAGAGGDAEPGGDSDCADTPDGTTLVVPLSDINGPEQPGPLHFGQGDNIVRNSAVVADRLVFNSEDGVFSVNPNGGPPRLLLASRGSGWETPAIVTPFWPRPSTGEVIVRDGVGWRRQAVTTVPMPPTDLSDPQGSGIYDPDDDLIITVETDPTSGHRFLSADPPTGAVPTPLRALAVGEVATAFVAGSGRLFYLDAFGGNAVWRHLTLASPGDDSVFSPSLPGGVTLQSIVFVHDEDVYAVATSATDFNQSGVYRMRAGGAGVLVASGAIIGGMVDVAVASPTSVVIKHNSGFAIVPTSAVTPQPRWFRPSTASLTCLSYGLAIADGVLYSTMFDSNSKETLVYSIPLATP